MKEDKTLIRKSIRGDHGAFKELVLKYGPRLLTTCRRYTPVSIPAEDILQEAFIKVYENLDKIDFTKGDFFSYSYKICIHTALSRQLKTKRYHRHISQSQNAVTDDHSVSDYIEKMEVEEVMNHLSHIPKIYADVFNLFAIEGYPHNEVAEVLHISVSTSRVYLARARELLKKRILQKSEKQPGMEQFHSSMKNKVHHHESHFDGEGFWRQLKPKLPEKKKRRFPVWILFGLFLTGLCVVLCKDRPMKEDEVATVSRTSTIQPSIVPSSTPPSDASEKAIIQNTGYQGSPETAKKPSSHPRVLVHHPSLSPISQGKSARSSTFNDSPKILPSLAQSPSRKNESASVTNLPLISKRQVILPKEELPIFPPSTEDEPLSGRHRIWSHSISMATGVFLHQNNWRSVLPEGESWMETRSFERPFIGYQQGIAYRVNYLKKWGISIGLSYKVFLEKLDFSQAEVSTTRSISTITQSTPSGDTTFTRYQYQTTSEYTRVKHLNRRTYLSLPIALHYSTFYHGWTVALYSGITLDQWMGHSGKVITPQGEILDEKDVPEIQWKKSPISTFLFGLEAQRRITDHWTLSLGCSLNPSISDVTTKESLLSLHYQTYGIHFGLTYMMN